jgi:hypothetical protein
MAAMFGNVRGDARQLGHLMATWLAHRVSLVQPVGTAAALLRKVINDLVYLFGGDQCPRVTWMTRLPARSATTLESSPAFSLPTGKPVRGRRLRSGRGILLAERKLPFEVGDLFRLLRELFPQAFVLASQSLDLLCLLVARITKPFDSSRSLRVLRLHRPERTKFLRKVQVQNACQTS